MRLDHLGAWPELEHATVRLLSDDGPQWACNKCNDRGAVVELSDGVTADEESRVCAVCLFAAVMHYPERDDV